MLKASELRIGNFIRNKDIGFKVDAGTLSKLSQPLGIDVTLGFVNKSNGYWKDKDSRTFDTEVEIKDWKGKHTIPIEQKKELIRFVKRKLDWFMDYEFGDEIFNVEKLQKSKREYDSKLQRLRIQNFSAWGATIATLLFLFVNK